MSLARREEASVGQLGGTRCSLLLHRGVTREAWDTRELCVSVCWQVEKEQLCVCKSLLQVASLHSRVRCVWRSAWGDPWQGHPFSSSTHRRLYVDASGFSIKLHNYSTKRKLLRCPFLRNPGSRWSLQSNLIFSYRQFNCETSICLDF